jgi:hypothetical protein
MALSPIPVCAGAIQLYRKLILKIIIFLDQSFFRSTIFRQCWPTALKNITAESAYPLGCEAAEHGHREPLAIQLKKSSIHNNFKRGHIYEIFLCQS